MRINIYETNINSHKYVIKLQSLDPLTVCFIQNHVKEGFMVCII